MEKRKIICFALVTIMISVSLIPATSGLNLEKKERKKTDNQTNFSKLKIGGNPELAICLKKIEYDRFKIIDGQGYSIYDVEYTAENIGDMFYFGWPLHEIKKPNVLGYVFYDWYDEHFLFLLKGRKKSFMQKIQVRTSEIFDIADERYFAGQLAELRLNNDGCYPDDTDSNIEFVKYWNDDDDYEPTLAHLLVSTPWQYEINSVEINGENLSYLNLIKNENLPEIIENQRLGWVKNLTIHLENMIDDVKSIFAEYDDEFLLEAWPQLQPVVMWMISLGNYFVKMLHDVYDPNELNDIFDNFIGLINCNIPVLKHISNHHYTGENNPVDKLAIDTEKFDEWIKTEPWKQPIKIMGKIEGLKENEVVEISCKNVSHIYQDEDDGEVDNIINYEFYLPMDPLNTGNSYFEPQKCIVTINGSKHENIIKTQKMISYCFSNGTLVKNFDKDSWNGNKKGKTHESISSKYPVLSKIFNLITDLPILKSINNKQTQNSDIVYKEYYPGAPTDDPNIVYYEPGEVIVTFSSFVAVQVLTEFFECKILDVLPDINAALLDVSGRQEDIWTIILLLCDLLEVKFAELNIVTTVASDPPGDYDDPEWPKKILNCESAWELTQGDPSIDIAIVDSGISSHTDIKKPKSEIDFASNNYIWDYNAQDDVGHGTKVTGIIMATWNNKGIEGVAPKCNYHAVKVLSPSENDPGGNTNLWAFTSGICYAARPTGLFGLLGLDAEVICCAATYRDEKALNKFNVLRGACNRARNVYHSVIIVSAHDTSTDEVCAPAAYDTTICVGSVDKNKKRCTFFSPSSELIDIVAPGKNIYTTNFNNDYEFCSGNSFSTAYVAGIAALYLSYKGTHSPMSMEDVERCENALISSAQKLEGEQYCGAGLVDAYKTLKYKQTNLAKTLI